MGKRKIALPAGKEKIAGATRRREQAKTKTHEDEAENQVSKSAADASDRGGMQTRGGRRKSNTTGRWRTKGNKAGMKKRVEGEIMRKTAGRKNTEIRGIKSKDGKD